MSTAGHSRVTLLSFGFGAPMLGLEVTAAGGPITYWHRTEGRLLRFVPVEQLQRSLLDCSTTSGRLAVASAGGK